MFWKFDRDRAFRRSLACFSADRGRIAVLLAVIAAGSLVGLLQVWPVAILVDTLSAAESGGKWDWLLGWLPEAPVARIAVLASAALVLKFAQELLGTARALCQMRIAHDGLGRLRCDLFDALQALNLQFHRTQPRGDLLYRLTNDAAGCQTILTTFVEVVTAAVTLAIMVALLLASNPALTLVALAVVPAIVLLNWRYGRILEACSRDARQRESDFTSTAQRTMSVVGLVQAFGRERDEYDRFRRKTEDSLFAWLRVHRSASRYRLWVGLAFAVGTAGVLGVGGWQVHAAQRAGLANGTTVGDLIVFLAYLAMFYDPLCRLTGAGVSSRNGLTGMRRVFEVLDRDRVIHDAPHAAHLPLAPRTITLESVGFGYEPGRPVLTDANLAVRPGEMIGIVGPSGAGKSSVLNLVCRFYDPDAGHVRFDEHDLRDVPLRDVRRHVALVLQENPILPVSVAENVAYGRPDATLAEIREATELAGATDFVESLPDGFLTVLPEDGQTLSGGQRQRLAIARALLTNAPVLVMDEPSSALDHAAERRLVSTLFGLKGHRSIVIVSHRLSTLEACDRIYTVRDGRLVEVRGTESPPEAALSIAG